MWWAIKKFGTRLTYEEIIAIRSENGIWEDYWRNQKRKLESTASKYQSIRKLNQESKKITNG